MKYTNHNGSMDQGLEPLKNFILERENLLVITGAGVSTGSGIGDYRDRDGQWKRPRPVSHQDFINSYYWRQRYWARSQLGYPSFLQAAPNRAHRALARLECQGQLCGLVTQNVDRLHQQAGHQDVVDLHGRLDQVICMDCGVIVPRRDVQTWLEERNPQLQNQSFQPAPDGDADMEMDFSSVDVPHCSACGGILKPHVVFYGDSVERRIVNDVNSKVENADGVLVVGSSLMVFSSYRFIRHAHASGVPVAALNKGVTRADDMFALKVEEPADRLDAIIEV